MDRRSRGRREEGRKEARVPHGAFRVRCAIEAKEEIMTLLNTRCLK